MDFVSAALLSLGFTGEAAASARAALRPARTLGPGEELTAQEGDATGLHLLISGVVKSSRNLDSGLAQTLALYTAGEAVGLQAIALGREANSVVAVTKSRVSSLPASRLRALQRDHPQVTEGLWRAMARESAILQEWTVGMGRRTALSQIAHLLCEIAERMRLAGGAHGDTYEFPLTQCELADAVGLSPVHVNRILQTLRSEGLVALSRSKLQIGDWERLADLADFDPAYLGQHPSLGDRHAALLLPPGDAGGPRARRDWEPLPER